MFFVIHLGSLSAQPNQVLNDQPPELGWYRGHGTDAGDHVHYGMQTSDGGYIMVGETNNESTGSDILAIKTNEVGDLEWKQVLGHRSRSDYAIFVIEVGDSFETEKGFIVAGATNVDNQQRRCLLKFDFDGSIIWQRIFPASQNSSIRGLCLLNDDSIIATGFIDSEQVGYQFISDDGKGFVLKRDKHGNLIWDKELTSTPHGIRVEQTVDGLAIGANVWVENSTKEHQQLCLILTDSKGNEKFSKTYGGEKNDQVFDFSVTVDGGFIFAGHTLSYGVVNWDFLLLKFNKDFEEEWHQTFGQPRGYNANYIHDESYGVKELPDGGFVVAGGTGDEYGYSESGHNLGPSDLWLAYIIRTDKKGNLKWQGLYGSPDGNNAAEYINLTNDGGFVIFTDSDTVGVMKQHNFGLMKLRPER